MIYDYIGLEIVENDSKKNNSSLYDYSIYFYNTINNIYSSLLTKNEPSNEKITSMIRRINFIVENIDNPNFKSILELKIIDKDDDQDITNSILFDEEFKIIENYISV